MHHPGIDINPGTRVSTGTRVTGIETGTRVPVPSTKLHHIGHIKEQVLFGATRGGKAKAREAAAACLCTPLAPPIPQNSKFKLYTPNQILGYALTKSSSLIFPSRI